MAGHQWYESMTETTGFKFFERKRVQFSGKTGIMDK
tara:strand:+ start:481 stop:588 length:108 start_codon:yes stop_codon:yes gene_type:complete